MSLLCLSFASNQLKCVIRVVSKWNTKKSPLKTKKKKNQHLKLWEMCKVTENTARSRKTLKYIPLKTGRNWTNYVMRTQNCVGLILTFYNWSLEYLKVWVESFDGTKLRSTIFQDLNMVKHSKESESTYLTDFVL